MTNTTKLTAAALFSALVLGAAFAGTNNVSAQAGPDTAKGGTVTETGHAYVTFQRGSQGQVKTPSDPGVSYTPDNPSDITNETGDLTLDAIPSSLNFGTNDITGVAQTVDLLPSAGDGKRELSSNGPATSDHGTDPDGKVANDDTIFTQVTNVSSNPVKWSLSATLSNFYVEGTTVNKDKNAISGAYITMTDGKAVHAEAAPTAENPDAQTWADAATKLSADTKGVLTFNANQSTPIIENATQQGVFQQQWKDSGVKLVAPNGVTVGQYAADMAWTLSVTPATDTTTTTPTGDVNLSGNEG